MNQQLRAKKVRELLNKFAVKNNTYSVNELRIILAIERIIARLSSDVILEAHLIYKGGFVMMKTIGSERFTRDLDALGFGIEKEDVARLVPLALEKKLDDGFWFGDIKGSCHSGLKSPAFIF